MRHSSAWSCLKLELGTRKVHLTVVLVVVTVVATLAVVVAVKVSKEKKLTGRSP